MSFLSRFSPVPSFPPLPGPYQVGTVDIEIAAEDLESAVPKPEDAPATIAYRIFYPCEKTTTYARPVRWIQSPQKENLAGFIKYMGVGDRVAGIVAALPTPISHISLPATRSAPLLPYPGSSPWPTTLFSHGLAGSRNLYSHLCCSLSSHGQIVIAPSHRDGSAPVAHVRATPSTPAQTVPSITIPYSGEAENYAARDKQLRIRCWEVGLILQSLGRVQRGEEVRNLDPNPDPKRARQEVLSRFKGVIELGDITFSGHSFGAATVVQFVKAVYYRDQLRKEQKAGDKLFDMDEEKARELVSMVGRATRLCLLDPWMMPILSPFQKVLRERQLPAFEQGGKGGKKVLAIVSEGFWKWKQNLEEVRRLLRPTRQGVEPGRAWYAVGSRHFSQSDFGVLFSWLLERFSKAANGRELLEGNVRLINQMLKEDGVDLAGLAGLMEEEKGEMKDADGDAHHEPAQDQQEQIDKPVSEAMPTLLDDKVWIRIPIEDNA
ncbi:Platelet-activating factor acetylhydrolase-like protein 2 [Elsinoe fawcettii]|nr:Platelet-activating factor acetylhydrolase-like protein 2 [Elsinoe fawcettii]